MSKTRTTPAAKAPVQADVPAMAPAAAPAPELPMPTQGGCYIRLPDGSLIPDTTQQAETPAQE